MRTCVQTCAQLDLYSGGCHLEVCVCLFVSVGLCALWNCVPLCYCFQLSLEFWTCVWPIPMYLYILPSSCERFLKFVCLCLFCLSVFVYVCMCPFYPYCIAPHCVSDAAWRDGAGVLLLDIRGGEGGPQALVAAEGQCHGDLPHQWANPAAGLRQHQGTNGIQSLRIHCNKITMCLLHGSSSFCRMRRLFEWGSLTFAHLI